MAQKPLEGMPLVLMDHCAIAGDVHAGSGLDHRQRGYPYDCR
ncbi:Uncharacterised protein [Pantoea agglomerans]|uniref:Uncharacterized protein n=1 Tax=Enterobacter agglomerans TaxID=549 RepID=A0A379ACZ4_ENTAG|nr:Uncharacterised protein [Pantoea agglomerans]